MDEQRYTIKQIADILHLSKQKVYRCIKSNDIPESGSEVIQGNTVLMYSEAAFFKIKTLLGASSEVHRSDVHQNTNDTRHDTLMSVLLNQIDVKDKQISDLNNQIEYFKEEIKRLQEGLRTKDEQLICIFKTFEQQQKEIADKKNSDEVHHEAPTRWFRLFRRKDR